MKPYYMDALKKGTVVKSQKFETERGVYTVTLIRYKREVYFFKDLNGTIVECCNLNRFKVEEKKNAE